MHRPSCLTLCALVLAIGGGPGGTPARAEVESTLEPLLERGDLEEAAEAMQARLERDPEDDEARFGLGLTSFLQAVERLGQANHRYGVMQQYANAIPLLRLPTPVNPDPQRISYDDARNVLRQLIADLEETRAVLGEVDTAGGVKLRVHLGRYRLDLDGNGEATEEEAFWRILQRYNAGLRQEDADAFVLGLDGGDVHWLVGYTHFLSAVGEVGLAHDFRESFERTGHLFYPRVESPHDFLADYEPARGDIRSFMDIVAFVHLLNFPVEEPERMQKALAHLEAMVAESRLSWKRILAETDDDHEWLPGPNQTSVIGARVPREMIDGWHEFLDEAEAILAGEKLIPFWRDYLPDQPVFLFGGGAQMKPIARRGRGINLRKVFTHPRRFDLVMWIQGTAATPYLEEGELSQPETWARLQRVFRGEFFGFVIWFN